MAGLKLNVAYIPKRKRGPKGYVAPKKGYWEKAYTNTLHFLEQSIVEANGRYQLKQPINQRSSIPEDLLDKPTKDYTADDKRRIKAYRLENGFVRTDGSIIPPDGSSYNWKIVSGTYDGSRLEDETVEIYLKVGKRSKVPAVFEDADGNLMDTFRCNGMDAKKALEALRDAVKASSKDDGNIGQKLYEAAKSVYKPKVSKKLNFDNVYKWDAETDQYIKK